MLLPLTGCIFTSAMFAVIGVVVLRLTGVKPMRPLVLAAFIVAAQVGLAAYGGAYGALFADSNNNLQSTAAVIGLLVGMPVVGAVAGWFAARAVATWLSRKRAMPS